MLVTRRRSRGAQVRRTEYSRYCKDPVAVALGLGSPDSNT